MITFLSWKERTSSSAAVFLPTSPRHRPLAGPGSDRAGPARRPGRRSRCASGRCGPTAWWPGRSPTGAGPCGSRRSPYLYRVRLAERGLGIGDHSTVRGRPGHRVLGPDLEHRPVLVADSAGDLIAATPGHPRVRRHLLDLLGERLTRTPPLGASPPPLVPDQPNLVAPVWDVPWPGDPLALARGREHPARLARRRRLVVGDDVHHTGTVGLPHDSLDSHSGQVKKQRCSYCQQRAVFGRAL